MPSRFQMTLIAKRAFLKRILKDVREFFFKRECPGRVAQVVGVLSCAPKGCRFDSRSGYICRLWVRSPVGCLGEAIN